MSILIKNVLVNNKKQDIFIEKNIIKDIGKIDEKADKIIDGTNKAVLPGFVNAHTHSPMCILKGYADDLPLNEWLTEKIWPLEGKMNEEDIYYGTKLACLEMIKTGTIAFNDMYWYPEASIVAVKEMGIRAVIGLIMADFSSLGSKENVKKIYEKFKNFSETITFSVAPHAIYTVSKENLIWAKNFARQNNLILHIHVSETEEEVKNCIKEHKKRPIEYLNEIGFLGENCVLAHAIYLNKNEIKILKEKNASVVYNPTSNMKLGSGIFNYKKFKEYGVNVALGTDGSASNNSLDMFSEMKFGALLQKGYERNPEILSAYEIFKMATENGLNALKIKRSFSENFLLENTPADLILIDLNSYFFFPCHNLISNIVYAANGSCVSDVICNGKILMENRKIEGEEEIKKNATERAKELIKRIKS